MVAAPVLSLADLEQFDPLAPDRGGAERRYCCPLCGDGKPVDAEHRSVSTNVETGLWRCHRCAAGGRLREFWTEKAPERKRRGRAVPRGPVRTPANQGSDITFIPDWRERLDNLEKLNGTLGAAYLQSRGVELAVAVAAGVRYSDNWYGTQAAVFPVRDQAGRLVAAVSRRIDARKPKSYTAGFVGQGVFATAGAWKAEPLILVEGPLDALTLATLGYPAIALCGAGNLPHWLPEALAFRRVLLAFDRDEAGDRAAVKVAAALAPLGASVERMRPGVWWSDWNEFSAVSLDHLRQALQADLG